MCPWRENCCKNGVLEQLVVGDHGETDEYAGTGANIQGEVSMLFVVLSRWRSPGLSCRVSVSQRLFIENHWMDRLCLRVLLTPVDLRNGSFQNFIPH